MHHERGFARHIEHLPYFVPPVEGAPPDIETSPHHRPYFLFVGRLEKIKGLQNLIPLFRSYSHADLLIAGTGEYEAELRRLAAGLQNIVFLGALQQPQLQRIYRHAIAVIVPSICYEVFGIIILEAYRERTPVIVHRLGGLQEVVEESNGGFSYRTPEELLTAMERLQTDEELRRTMGEHGFQKYVERWSEEAHLRTYFQLLEGAAQQKFGYVPWKRPDGTALEAPTLGRSGS
jgi:glycosyltransferase involved in cell wall biosynthesis